MKRYINTTFFLVCTFASFAQAPQKFNYQAVARNAQGAVLPNQTVKIRASILDGSANGANQYSETHSVTTSHLGLFNLAIGGGTVVSGSFINITWARGDKYLKIEMDATGGNNFLLSGTSQLLSVPYAQYAERANFVTFNTLTTSQILNYPIPYNGLSFLNSDDNSIYYFSNSKWYKIASTVAVNPSSICVKDALVAYYNFDATSIGEDVINNTINYDGINSGVDFSPDVNTFINSGKSAEFSNNDKINIPENPLYNLSQGSICFWLKATASSLPVIHGNNAASTFFTVEFSQSKLRYNGSTDFFNFDLTPYLNNAWHHFVVTLKPNEHRLYVDGLLLENITHKAWGMTNTQSNSGMIIGKYNTNSLIGRLDNLRIHSRVLTQSEIQQIYNCGQ